MNVKQITIFIEDKPGTLGATVRALKQKHIHIRAFTAVDMGGMTILRLLVDNVMWTAAALKEAGYPSSFTDVLVVEMEDSEEGLVGVLDILKEAAINIQHVYPVMTENPKLFGQKTHMVFEVNDNAKAAEILKSHGIRVLSQEELAEL